MPPIRASLALARSFAALALLAATLPIVAEEEPAAEATKPDPKTSADVLAASKPSDWRTLDPANTLYLELPGGRVVIELAPAFAPRHVANVTQLVRQRYFDGLAMLRSQDNYVVQWGDPAAGDGGEDGDATKKRSFGEAKPALPAEMDRAISGDLPFTKLPDGDVYAPEVGFSLGFPAARDPQTGRAWLVHCYAMVGAGRDAAADSGSGAELYVVIGHAPRHLDRNVTLLGRVVQGMEVLSTLPRGTGALGFYEDPAEYVPIASIRLGSDLPEAERAHIELLRTDTSTFEAWIDARRNRREEWFLDPVGKVGLCNVPLPVRERVKAEAGEGG
jgi:peptidylprolyl isomerase